MLEIHLLGEMRIAIDGEPQPTPTSLKARLVLAYLAEPGGNHARQVLAEHFWDTSPSSAMTSLNTELKNLRRCLGSCSTLLVARRGYVGLPQCDDLWVDVRRFAENLRGEQYADALELWRGDFLQDTSGEWADQARTGYRRMAARVLAGLADECEAAGDLAAAADHARRQRDLLPDEIEGWKRLLRVLTANGDLLVADAERSALVARHVKRGRLPRAVREAIDVDVSAIRPHRSWLRDQGTPPSEGDPNEFDSRGARDRATPRRVPGATVAEELVGPAGHPTAPVYTGFADLDEVLGGLPEPGLSVIAGRPGMGASTLALSIAANASLDFGISTALCSIELSEAQLAQRLVGMRGAITSAELRRGVPEQKWTKLLKVSQLLAAAPLWIDDSPQLEMKSLLAKLQQLKGESGLRLLVLDSIHGFTTTSGPALDSHSIAALLFELRQAARQFELSVIVTMEVLGDCEKRWDKRPQLRDLPCYFELAAPRDVVLLLYRDEYYDVDSERVAELDVFVAENRGGPVGRVTLTFDARIPRVLNFSISPNAIRVTSA